jgi:hypothetical protein
MESICASVSSSSLVSYDIIVLLVLSNAIWLGKEKAVLSFSSPPLIMPTRLTENTIIPGNTVIYDLTSALTEMPELVL